MHDSYTPVGGLVTILNMLFGEVVFGGLGTGLYTLVLIALVGLFVAGLMIGRTPEYLGKQVTVAEMKLIALYTIAAPLTILPLAAVALVTDAGLAGLTINKGPHGLSEILVAYTMSMANNGQNFAGLSANTPFYNITTAPAMMASRFDLAIPALALAARFGPAAEQAGHRRDAAHRHAAVCRAHDRDDPRRGRPQLPAGPGPRPARRATPAAIARSGCRGDRPTGCSGYASCGE
jgi:K+-transporting ATPase ATPase A chain